jgi:ankyrin repeat protein
VLVVGLCVAACAGGADVNGTRVEELFADPRTRALALAAGRGDAAEVARLVRAGADPNARGRDGVVPLTWSMGRRSHAGTRALLAAGADPDAAIAPGLKPLELAAGSTDPELLRILLDAKGDPNALDSDGNPILHSAVMMDDAHNLRLLVGRGADVNAADSSGTTAALVACATSRWDHLAWLLEHGADPLKPDRSGGTAANCWQDAGPPADAHWRREYDRVGRVLAGRGVRFPAETPEQVRLRVFGPDNPIDARIRRERAARGGQP